ncbi:hypothetical protein K461DRAFT_37550 [Myriangium duriaei CBS 260.36]|uniref:Uncharacterized protein n=1 Tax=Myriangium duriaei CBS 260.36 TaxID=1168546 RepID=A0A9P4IW90_9PEZI|nr:hypothetical protein K461DRAFT_37550 [Myriangium duriaei CBS 260.36]
MMCTPCPTACAGSTAPWSVHPSHPARSSNRPSLAHRKSPPEPQKLNTKARTLQGEAIFFFTLSLSSIRPFTHPSKQSEESAEALTLPDPQPSPPTPRACPSTPDTYAHSTSSLRHAAGKTALTSHSILVYAADNKVPAKLQKKKTLRSAPSPDRVLRAPRQPDMHKI